MKMFRKLGAVVLAVVLIGSILTGCRGAKRQGCPTFSLDIELPQGDFLND